MFNTPILDIVIGLLFIFLLYSLLATSIKEGIATLFALRARMLRRGIIAGMLSDTPDYGRFGRWKSVGLGLWGFLQETLYVFTGRPEKKNKKLGDYFYAHPLLRNYGSSRIFPDPSYLPPDNFSTILIDILKQDFERKGIFIARVSGDPTAGTDIDKIKVLLDQYASYYTGGAAQGTGRNTAAGTDRTVVAGTGTGAETVINGGNCIIDEDTLRILLLKLKESHGDLDGFKKQLEIWFDESMDRVSGWYKRQVQVILLIIGFLMAVAFNVDTIDIAGRLSKDDKLREHVVQSAVGYSKIEGNRPAPGGTGAPAGSSAPGVPGAAGASTDSGEYMRSVNERFGKIDSMVNHDIRDINSLMALGYGDFGRTDTVFVNALKDKIWLGFFYKVSTRVSYDSIVRQFRDTIRGRRQLDSLVSAQFFNYQMKEYPVHVKTAFIWYTLWAHKRKWLSFLILGLAVCLGAPFWFDMLSKVINLRATGKKESDTEGSKKDKKAKTG